MDWTAVLTETARLLRDAQEDYLLSESTRIVAGTSQAQEWRDRAASDSRKTVRTKAVEHLIELRKQRELLLTAPPGTPGVEAALRNVEAAIKKRS
jgi:hypothetical protein